MKKYPIVILGIFAFTFTAVILGCSHDEECEEVFNEQEFTTLASKVVTRSADANTEVMRVVAGHETLNMSDPLFNISLDVSWETGNLTRGNPPAKNVESIDVDVLKPDSITYKTYECELAWLGSCHLGVTLVVYYYLKHYNPQTYNYETDTTQTFNDPFLEDIIVPLEPDPVWVLNP